MSVTTKRHGDLAPSASHRWMECAGSELFIKQSGVVDKRTIYSAEGEVAHEIAVICLDKGYAPLHFLGQTWEVEGGFTVTITEEMVENIALYVDYIESDVDDFDVEVDVEIWCSLKSLNLKGLEGGTSDSIKINRERKRVEVVDYKNGVTPVEAENNSQLMLYALGVLIELGVSKRCDWDVVITIVQPRAHHSEGKIRSWVTTSENIFTWCDEKLIPAAKAVYKKDAPLKPTVKGCLFCPVKGNCSALHNKTLEVTKFEFR